MKELVNPEPRTGRPLAATTMTFVLRADGQMDARWKGIPSWSPPAGFLVSIETVVVFGPLSVKNYPLSKRAGFSV